MSIFKCKMCGGALEISKGLTIATCEYCGTQQTLPNLNSERKSNLYDRANHFRRNNDFDKAMSIYEQVLNEDTTDAEAYWSLVLCKYGIEYVDDPLTHKKIPTVNRTQYTSIFADENYKSALEYADISQKSIYEAEAKVIDDIQKGILEISSKEEPFDVFICYKETDENGRRTKDSVLANDLYHQLTQESLKVFFAKITLEDKLGEEYEPYIFAALNSAKVMVVLGTRPEYFNAVWVKNEWSRYLSLIASGSKKILIPAYKDMDPYDLPEEFSHLQALDMSKLGFVQDLIRGIKKITAVEERTVTQINNISAPATMSSNVAALIDRGNMALEDGEWDKADSFFEDVLNNDSRCAEAYLGKLLAANRVDSLEKYFSILENKYSSVTSEKLYACNEEVEHINSVVKENVVDGYLEAKVIENLYRFDRSYMSALSCRKAQKEKQLTEIESDKVVSRVSQYATGELKGQIESGLENLILILDSRVIEEQHADEAKIAEITENYQLHIEDADRKVGGLRYEADKQKYRYYESIIADMNSAVSVSAFEKVYNSFRALGEYEDSLELAQKCHAEIDRLKEEESNRKVRLRRRIAIISISLVVTVIILFVIVEKVIIPNSKYNEAIMLMNNRQYNEAITAFENLDGYKESNDLINNCRMAILDDEYDVAVELMNNGQYDEAIVAFEKLDGYRECNDLINNCRTAILDDEYDVAVELMNNGQYDEAIAAFEKLDGYKDSAIQIENCQTTLLDVNFENAIALMESGDYSEAIELFRTLDGYNNSEDFIASCEFQILSKLHVRDTFYYGVYNDKPIEWTILENTDNKILVITTEAIDKRPYNTQVGKDWSECSLREWLNNDFYLSAFNSNEQERLLITEIEYYNSDYGWRTSSDRLFLLTWIEAYNLFYSVRKCKYQDEPCWWWLMEGEFVNIDGEPDAWGHGVKSNDGAVRPAMWIDLTL